VLHTGDRAAYETVHGAYVDLRAVPPGEAGWDEEGVADVFTGGDWNGARAALLRAAFRERFCPWDDGRAAERVVRHVVLGRTDPAPVVPPAERRPVPSAAAATARSALATVPHPKGPRPVTEAAEHR